MVDAVDHACQLAARFAKARVRSYGAIRIDSAENCVVGHVDTPEEQARLDVCVGKMADKAAEYGEDVVCEGEICWRGMEGWRPCLELHQRVNRENVFFMGDTSHNAFFAAGHNRPAQENLLPKGTVLHVPSAEEKAAGLRRVTFAEMATAWAKIAEHLGPITRSFHIARCAGRTKGGGDHQVTGEHAPPNDKENIVDLKVVAPLFLLEEAG